MPNTIEKELTVSSIFDPYFHATNSGEMIDLLQNNEVVGDIIAALKSEYCIHTYDRHNDQCGEDTI